MNHPGHYPKWIGLWDYIHDQFDIEATEAELREIIRLAPGDEPDSPHNPAAQQAKETISAGPAGGMSHAQWAASMHALGMKNAEAAPPNSKQKFLKGGRVHIAEDLGPQMRHFAAGVDATVEYAYAQAYGGNDFHSYSLNVDGIGSVSWYQESQLTEIGGV